MDYLNQRMDIVQLRSKVDYREELLKESVTKDKMYYKLENDEEIRDFVTKISKMFYGKVLQESSFKVHGRIQKVPKASEGIALYTFDELCGSDKNPMGVPDYLKLCQLYHTIIVQNIPQMTILEKNEARRFITFIDAAYENKIKLICSAETDPEKLFVISDIESLEMMHKEMIGDILAETNSPNEMMKLAIFTGEDEKFAFKRAVSRLKEMQSDLYLTTPVIKEKHKEAIHIPQVSDDFASEASYATSAKKAAKDIKIRREEKVPKFQDQHFWGMSDDWGPDAGKWGEGIKGFFKSYIFKRKR
jgi:protein AFG1